MGTNNRIIIQGQEQEERKKDGERRRAESFAFNWRESLLLFDWDDLDELIRESLQFREEESSFQPSLGKMFHPSYPIIF